MTLDRFSQAVPPALIEGEWEFINTDLDVPAYEKLKAALMDSGRHSYRNMLLAQFLFNTGLRISEALAVTPAHVRRSGGDILIAIRRGKSKNAQEEAMPVNAELGLAIWNFAQGLGLKANQRIFGITSRRAEQIFAAAGEKALGRRVHPHQLRALFTTYSMDALGLPVETVSKMLGHTSTKTTMEYYYKLNPERHAAVSKSIPI